ncbi:hypothetical protein EDB19DRAFT_262509 [Suillus lakei]|nr:hypothetical protein EDB19DRAFT_262509 [Suillus lakei]
MHVEELQKDYYDDGRGASTGLWPHKPVGSPSRVDSHQHSPRSLLQCRTGHGFTGEYYVSFVPTEPISCLCGEPRQTPRTHYVNAHYSLTSTPVARRFSKHYTQRYIGYGERDRSSGKIHPGV